MNLAELIQHRLIVETQPSNQEPPHVVAYDYEKVFLSGTLEAIALHPETLPWEDISVSTQKEDLTIRRGSDYLIPLVVLYHVLAVRLKIACDHPYILFRTDKDILSKDVDSDQLDPFLIDLRAINMHNMELTNGYYKRLIEPLTDDRCATLYQTLNTISL